MAILGIKSKVIFFQKFFFFFMKLLLLLYGCIQLIESDIKYFFIYKCSFFIFVHLSIQKMYLGNIDSVLDRTNDC